MPHVHWLNCEKKCPFRIYGIHINWGQINETKNEITEFSSKCQFKNYYIIYGAMLKYVFPLILHVSSLYKCLFDTILSFFFDMSDTYVFLSSSALKLAKKFNSNSFNQGYSVQTTWMWIPMTKIAFMANKRYIVT